MKKILESGTVEDIERQKEIDRFDKPCAYEHYESKNEDFFECKNDYLDGTMSV